jgi:Glycosyl hydrolase family 99
MGRVDRRRFLTSAASLPALLSLRSGTGWRGGSWTDVLRESSVLASIRSGAGLPGRLATAAGEGGASTASVPPLAKRFGDVDRRFVLEYYPWYRRDPWRHWDGDGRRPPDDLATRYVPRLGAYDSRDSATLEQHARWIAGSGVGSVALSWWGRGSYEDARVHDVMDVMKDHGIAVTFGLEPYADDRGSRLREDVLYLLREYGQKRGWDAFLVLRSADGSESPVLKGFRCILPDAIVDCHGIIARVPDYTPDSVWREQIDGLREDLRHDFDRVLLLADSLDFGRTPASGFDGIGIYDNFIAPVDYAGLARGASRAGLLFSFNVNPGYDEILLRDVSENSCYQPRPFAPPAPGPALDFDRAEDRERAAALSAERIRESLKATVEVQSDPALSNYRNGFFLAYVNSFNEWHEGHAFEPMKDDVALTPGERAFGYRNPRDGDYRIAALGEELRELVSSPRDLDRRAGLTGSRANRC